MVLGAYVALFLATAPQFEEARRLYEELDYPRAEAALRKALMSPEAGVEERAEMRDLLARSLIAMGRADEAVDVYVALLRDDPQAVDPTGSPKVRETFARARFRLSEVRSPPPQAPSVKTPEAVQVGALQPEGPSPTQRWVRWTVTGVSVLAAIGGTAFAVSSAADSRQAGLQTRAVDTTRLDAQANQKAWAANALVGGAALGGVVAGVLWWRWP